MNKLFFLLFLTGTAVAVNAQQSNYISFAAKEDTIAGLFSHTSATLKFNMPGTEPMEFSAGGQNTFIEGRVLGQTEWKVASLIVSYSEPTFYASGIKVESYINLFELFTDTDSLTLLTYANEGIRVELRFRLLGSLGEIWDGPVIERGLFYSNSDTVYVMPTDILEVKAFRYLNKHIDWGEHLIWFDFLDYLEASDIMTLQHIVENFSSTIIAESAQHTLIFKYFYDHNENWKLSPADKQKVLQDLDVLLYNTKSKYFEYEYRQSIEFMKQR